MKTPRAGELKTSGTLEPDAHPRDLPLLPNTKRPLPLQPYPTRC